MKILFVAAQYNPFAPNKGGSGQRSHLILEALAKKSEVDVAICIEDVVSDIPNCNVVYSRNIDTWYHGFGNRKNKFKRLLKPWDPYAFFPVIPQFASEMSKIIEEGNYDWICTRYIETAIQGGLLRYADRLIVDVDDYPVDDMLKLSRMASSYRSRIYYYLLGMSMKYAIDKAIKLCKFIFSPNKHICKSENSAWLPNIPFYSITKRPKLIVHEHPTLLFVGGLSYEPNLHGIQHFITHVFPMVRTRIPDVILNIIGRFPNERVKTDLEQQEGVHVKGFVEDIQAEYAFCDVCVAAIYSGAGTNIKVAEALQMQRPCVITQTAYRGYDMLENGKDIIVVENDKQYAEEILKLLENSEIGESLSRNGYAKYKKYFSKIYFEDIVKEALNKLS